MTRPDDIPQDVWEAAEDAYEFDDYSVQVEAIARALLAERERSAKAVREAGYFDAPSVKSPLLDRQIAHSIAAIRGGAAHV